MSDFDPSSRPVAKLRRQAEDIVELAGGEQEANLSADVQSLLHELRVHQVELEIQNEELRDAQQVVENEKRRAEEVRDRFMRLFHEAPVGYAAVDQAGMIHSANQTLRDMTGLSADVPLGRASFAGLLHPGDEPVFRARFPAFFDQPSHKRLETRLRSELDEEFWVEITGRPVAWRFAHTPGQEVQTQLLLIVSDIRERKKLEEELSLAATVFEHSNEGMVITDAGGGILRVNQAFSLASGYAEDELVGKNLRVLQSSQHPEDFFPRIWQELNSREGWRGEFHGTRKNGESSQEWLHVYPVRNRSGKVTNFVNIFSRNPAAKTI